MKLIIIANNCKWESWPTKIKAIQDWFRPRLNLEVELKHTNFENIPFVNYSPEDPNDQKYRTYGIQPQWYDDRIPMLAIGADIVMFVLNRSQWEGEQARGWRTDSNTGPVELHLGCDENEQLVWPNMPRMDAFFQLARHELMHAMFAISRQYDTTHFYWALGQLEKSRDQLVFPKDWAVPGIYKMVAFLGKLITELSGKYEIPPALPSKPWEKYTTRERLYYCARTFLGTDASPADIAPDALGCAETINAIHKAAFGSEIGGTVSTHRLYAALRTSPFFERVNLPLPGDIIISPTGYGGKNGVEHGHAGIVGVDSKIMSSESSNGKFEENYTIESWRARYEERGGYPVAFFRRK